MRRASSWSLKAHAYAATGESDPAASPARSTSASRCRSIIPRSGCAPAASVSAGSRYNPLANFYLGGFGNNYVDSGDNGSAQRYRDLLSMPGFELDALQRQVAGQGDARVVPAAGAVRGAGLAWLLRQLGAAGAVCQRAARPIPATAKYRQEAHNVGAQVDFQLQVMHRWPMMLSIGVARGFAGGGFATTEFMLSLQVL